MEGVGTLQRNMAEQVAPHVQVAAAKAWLDHFRSLYPMKVAATDPTGTQPYQPMTDDERAARVMELLKRARDRERHGGAGDHGASWRRTDDGAS